MIDLWVPGRNLHLPPPRAEEFGKTGFIQAIVELGVWDRRHRMLRQFREPSRSPVKQLLQHILVSFAALTSLANVKDTGGTNRTIQRQFTDGTSTSYMYATGTSLGIQVGTGSTAVDILDYVLATAIANGSGAGQLVYQALTYDADVTVADPICTFIVYRNFNNNSGGQITVAETGFYCSTRDTGGTAQTFCLFRDVPTSVAVPDGGGCYVKYTLQISE